MKTRPATSEDSAFVYQVKVDALKSYVDQTWGWNDQFQQQFHQDSFDPQETAIILDDRQNAGFLIVIEHNKEIELKEINLLQTFQNKGIGSEILTEVLKQGAEKEKTVRLQVLKVNPAIKLYQRFGFEVYDETETHYLMKTLHSKDLLNIKIRQSTPSDRIEIRKIHNQSFGTEEGPVIVTLVDDLFDDETASPILSLVAEIDGKLVGHILFTKVTVTQTDASLSAQLLAPLAVLPETQGKGVGVELINEGLRQLKAAGMELVFVLGHPTYYPRCGFTPAGKLGFEAPYPIPDKNTDAWMVLELNGEAIGSVSGKVQCSDALNKPQYWRE